MTNRILFVAMVLCIAACSSDNNPPQPPPNQAPTIAQVANQSIEANQSTPVSVNIADDQTAASQLQLVAVSDNDQLVPAAAIVINGSGATRELIITPTGASTGSAQITLTVTDAQGVSASTMFALSVVPESVSYAQFLRDVFRDDKNSVPRDVNSREFIQDAGDDVFADLF